MKKLLLICLALLLMQGVCWSAEINSPVLNGQKDTLDHIQDLMDLPNPINLNDDLTITSETLFLKDVYAGTKEADIKDYFYRKKTDWLGRPTYTCRSLQGIKVSIANHSDQIYIVQWSGSAMSFGSFVGMPFLSGMKYIDAGKPNVTPDTIIPPKTNITASLYTSDVEFLGGEWYMHGEWIPADNSMNVKLYLKILNSENISKYYTIEFPHLGISSFESI